MLQLADEARKWTNKRCDSPPPRKNGNEEITSQCCMEWGGGSTMLHREVSSSIPDEIFFFQFT
jgi:hypothetical protein